MTVSEFTVGAAESGERLDKAIADRLGLSRSVAAGAIARGEILLDSATASRSTRLRSGQKVEIALQATGTTALAPEPVDFTVRFEDADIAVISKPAGIAVHPGAGVMSPTIAAGILDRWPSSAGVGDPLRPGIVHRLDSGTSGLMVIALTPAAHTGLSGAISRHEIEREYLALVKGSMDAPSGTVDAPIGRDPHRRSRMCVSESGRPARTHYRVLNEWRRGVALLRVHLETGRTHQIRVHMSSIGHPVVGDSTYGGAGTLAKDLGLMRPFLHSVRLAFSHPISGEPVEVVDDLASELEAALAVLEPAAE